MERIFDGIIGMFISWIVICTLVGIGATILITNYVVNTDEIIVSEPLQPTVIINIVDGEADTTYLYKIP